MKAKSPSVLVFDVNETLIDIEAITPLLAQIFGDPKAMREWFAQLVMYSMTTALARCYVDYFTLGQAVLRMLADIHQVSITDADLQHLTQAMLTLPAHPDVEDGLKTLRSNGFRVATLTNHAWDTIGAQRVGFSAALITRPGNAPLPLPLPQPTLVAADLRQLVQQLGTAA